MTRRAGRLALWWLLVIALTGTTIGAVAVGGWRMYTVSTNQPQLVADQPVERQAVVKAATTGAVRVLSYSPDTLDQDFSAAEACLTGDFLSYYKQFTSQVVAPAAQQKAVKTTATVPRAGVATLTGQKASILLFVNQTTTSKDASTPSLSTSSVNVGLTKIGDAWLIDSFNPV